MYKTHSADIDMFFMQKKTELKKKNAWIVMDGFPLLKITIKGDVAGRHDVLFFLR